jgi:REP element-mobilizing transposase RayT
MIFFVMKQRKSPRAQRYDYTSPGGYFVTICTKDRVHYFGEICRDAFVTHPNEGRSIMVLNDLGKICSQEIENMSNRMTVDIHEYIVMPNHIHLLLVMSHFTEDMNI